MLAQLIDEVRTLRAVVSAGVWVATPDMKKAGKSFGQPQMPERVKRPDWMPQPEQEEQSSHEVVIGPGELARWMSSKD